MTRLQAVFITLFGLSMITTALTLMYGWWALVGGGISFVVVAGMFEVKGDD
jgi:hypothetical protein